MAKQKSTSQSDTLKKVLTYISRYKIYILLSLITAAVTVASSLYVPILTGNAIDYIVAPGNVDYAAIISIIIQAAVVMAVYLRRGGGAL